MTYATADELRAMLGISDRVDDQSIADAIAAATQAVTNHCGRSFTDAGSATARTFAPMSSTLCIVDDFHTTSGLVVKTDTSDDATFATTWTSADYELEPLSTSYSAQPYYVVRAVDSYLFPTANRRRLSVQVTARWGWSSVPEPVQAATRLVAADLWKRKDAPLGIAFGMTEFGGTRIANSVLRSAESLLAPYRRAERVYGFA